MHLTAFEIINRLFRADSERTVRIKKNVAASFVLQFFNIGFGFVQVPLILRYIDNTQYGVWLTLSSLAGFLSVMDIGLGNGLRNRFAEAIAKGKSELARIYVSTTYALIALFMIAVLAIFLFIYPWVNWTKALNAPSALGKDIKTLVPLVFLFFCCQIVLKLVTTILTALQRPALYNLQATLTSGLNLVLIFLLIRTTNGNLLYFGIALAISPVIILGLYSLIFYTGSLKSFAPAPRYVRFDHARDVLGLGVRFFIIQISAVVIFQTQNVLIAQLMGPAQVTPFNIAYRYFGIVNMVFAIILFPFWSAFTDAYSRRDMSWIRATVNKLIKLWVAIFLLNCFLLAVSGPFYRFWLGGKVFIPFNLSLALFAYFSILTWGSIFVSFINGIGKIRVQFFFSIFSAILFVPVAIIFAKTFDLGIVGIVLAACFINVFGLIVAPWQYYKEIRRADYLTQAAKI